MADKNVLELTEENFESEVTQSKVPVLVDIWAPWCTPCLAMAPTIDELAGKFAGRVKVVKLNADDNPARSTELEVSSIPTLILFKDGKPVQRLVGLRPKAEIERELDKVA